MKNWLFAIALAAAVFLAYEPAWRGGFIFDDDLHLRNNPVLKPGGLASAWATGSYISYWPLTFTVYRLEFQIWGLNSLGFHLVNIGLHAVVSILMWRVLVELDVAGAMFAAAIFALHPVNVESVAWIAQLKGILSLLFALVSALFYLKYDRRGGWVLYLAALAAFCLSTLAKGMVITLPIVLLACAWWRRGAIGWRDLARVVIFALIGAAMAGVEIWTQRAGDAVRHDGVLSRIAVAGCAVWFYFGKLLWPFNLCFVYPRWKIAEINVFWQLPGLLLAILFALALWRRKTWGRPVIMMVVCYVALLLPALGFVNIGFMRFSLVADHWQYAAAIVPCAVLGAAAAKLAAVGGRRADEGRRTEDGGQRTDFPPSSVLRLPSFTLALLLLAALASLTWRQSRIYADSETLWTDTLAKDPDCWLAHNDLGTALAGRNKEYEAIDHFRKALNSQPDYADAHNNLGAALVSRNQVDEAIGHFRSAIKNQPGFASAHYNLANALAARGQFEEAIDHYQQALAINPDDAEVLTNLGAALSQRGQADEAISHYRKALKINRDLLEAHFHLASALAGQRRIDEALEHYQKALALACARNDKAVADTIRAKMKLIE